MSQPDSPTRTGRRPDDLLIHTTPLDELVAPVLADLEREYDGRYGNMFGQPASVEINRYPAAIFSARTARSPCSCATVGRSRLAPL